MRETRALEVVLLDPHISNRMRKKMMNKQFQCIEILIHVGRGESK